MSNCFDDETVEPAGRLIEPLYSSMILIIDPIESFGVYSYLAKNRFSLERRTRMKR